MAGSKPPPIAVTSGEPAGIGPDLCIKLCRGGNSQRLVILADREMLNARADLLGIKSVFAAYAPGAAPPPGDLEVLHIPTATRVQAGCLDPRNGAYVIALLRRALTGCENGEFAAMVTAPVHKAIINDAGIPFTGHTEFLAEQTRQFADPKLLHLFTAGAKSTVAASTNPHQRARENLVHVLFNHNDFLTVR